MDHEKQIAELRARAEKAEAELQATRDKQVVALNETAKAADTAAKAAEERAEALQGQVAELQKQVADLSQQLDGAKAAVTAAQASLVEAEGRLNAIEAEKTAAARLEQVRAAWEVDGDEAAKIVARLAKFDDAEFAEHVQAQADYLAAKKAAYEAAQNAAGTGVKPGETHLSDKPAPMGGGPKVVKTGVGPKKAGAIPPEAVVVTTQASDDDDDDAAAAAATSAVASATGSPDAALAASADDGEGVRKTVADICDYFAAYRAPAKTK